MPELAYRHPGGKAHRARLLSGISGRLGLGHVTCLGYRLTDDDDLEAVPVEQVDPGHLCKRCWPGVAP